MLNSVATGCASTPPLPAPPTATAAAARPAALATWLLHGLRRLQLSLFGDYPGRYKC